MKQFNPCLTAADSEAAAQRRAAALRKPLRTAIYLVLAFALTFFLLSLTGCVQSTTTAPDGTVTTTKAPAPGVLKFAGAAITAYSPRPIIVREEKSGRITKEEIDSRWKAAERP